MAERCQDLSTCSSFSAPLLISQPGNSRTCVAPAAKILGAHLAAGSVKASLLAGCPASGRMLGRECVQPRDGDRQGINGSNQDFSFGTLPLSDKEVSVPSPVRSWALLTVSSSSMTLEKKNHQHTLAICWAAQGTAIRALPETKTFSPTLHPSLPARGLQKREEIRGFFFFFFFQMARIWKTAKITWCLHLFKARHCNSKFKEKKLLLHFWKANAGGTQPPVMTKK